MESDALIGRNNPTGPNSQLCLSAGLCNAGASIVVGDRHVANWLIGQVRIETANEKKVLEYANKLGVDDIEFRDAYFSVPEMSKKQFAKAANVIYVMANLISDAAYQNIQQTWVIAERKRAEGSLHKFKRIVSTSQDVIALINRVYNETNRRGYRIGIVCGS
jgi:hypothetical protein